ncbi:MAG: hypothetical protein FD149_2474 [Rhodospirillaceae bacterium]|nr:MAG: hypothetical protein FD149_2474 [Rhodospirillaceae bacterium]
MKPTAIFDPILWKMADLATFDRKGGVILLSRIWARRQMHNHARHLRRQARRKDKMWVMVAEMRRRQIIEANLVRLWMKDLLRRLRKLDTRRGILSRVKDLFRRLRKSGTRRGK